MIKELILPKLGQTMEEGAIVQWMKSEGDTVERGEVVFSVESDKAILEVESTSKGILRKILVPAGQVVPVLTPVALITRTEDEDISSYGAPEPATAAAVPQKVANDGLSSHSVAEPQLATSRVFASPRARRTAREQGVELSLLKGTGPNSRIIEQDVLDFVAQRPRATPMAAKTAEALGVNLAALAGSGVSGRIMKADVTAVPAPAIPVPVEHLPALDRVPMTGMRQIIATRMAASDRATARVTLVTEIDATDLVEGREKLKAAVAEAWGFAPGYNDLLAVAVARALREFPYMNARLAADESVIEHLPYVNLGMAVDTERGLLVPVIRNADQLGLRAFGTEFRTLVDRARTGRSLPDDLSGGTFTITNLGMYEISIFTPIINLPEAAILGVGQIQPKPVVYKGEITIRHMWTLSLTFDHRLVDGAPAARFLQRVKQLLEVPFLLLA